MKPLMLTLKEYYAVADSGKKLAVNIYAKLWWLFCPGIIITVKWPHNEYSADPNEFYRPFLEENIGKQGWDWNWRIGGWEDNTLLIKLRRGKIKWASHLVIMW